jgi:aspartate/methionine/tyrosine aminotransferase
MAITAPLPTVTEPEQIAPEPFRKTQGSRVSAVPIEGISALPIGGISATLAANEAIDARRRRGERVLPMAFGEAGVPVAPVLRHALAAATHRNGYGPVAGTAELREAAAGYWTRRGLPTSADDVVCGPGSKALLFGLLLGLGQSGTSSVAVPQPSWVSYAAQASLTGVRPVYVPISSRLAGGMPDPDLLDAAATAAVSDGRPITAIIVTLPDNPTGTLAPPATVAAVCEVARRHGMLIISDEIYRDLIFSDTSGFVSPASLAPERTVVTSGLSKNLALGGWRLGVARLPGSDSPALAGLRDRLLAIGSEIWSAPVAPVQHAASLGFSDIPDITGRIRASRRLHGCVARSVADRFAAAGARTAPPQGGFYVYPDFEFLRPVLAGRFGIESGADLADVLLDRYGIGVLPGSAFGDTARALRVRVATSRLYGDTPSRQEAALAADDPTALPWIASSLDRLTESLTDLTS